MASTLATIVLHQSADANAERKLVAAAPNPVVPVRTVTVPTRFPIRDRWQHERRAEGAGVLTRRYHPGYQRTLDVPNLHGQTGLHRKRQRVLKVRFLPRTGLAIPKHQGLRHGRTEVVLLLAGERRHVAGY